MSAPYIPSEANGWLLEGRECECDVDSRCANHDTDAENAYYMRLIGPMGTALALTIAAHIERADAYEPGDPKRFEVDA